MNAKRFCNEPQDVRPRSSEYVRLLVLGRACGVAGNNVRMGLSVDVEIERDALAPGLRQIVDQRDRRALLARGLQTLQHIGVVEHRGSVERQSGGDGFDEGLAPQKIEEDGKGLCGRLAQAREKRFCRRVAAQELARAEQRRCGLRCSFLQHGNGPEFAALFVSNPERQGCGSFTHR